jgi:hypothetical protein
MQGKGLQSVTAALSLPFFTGKHSFQKTLEINVTKRRKS